MLRDADEDICGLTFHLAFRISAFVSGQSRRSGNDSVCNALYHKQQLINQNPAFGKCVV